MPPSRAFFPASTPTDAVRQALIGSLYKVHRPELADVVASADLAFDFSGVWLCPADATLSSVWLEEQLVDAALQSGLLFLSIHVLATAGQGSGMGESNR